MTRRPRSFRATIILPLLAASGLLGFTGCTTSRASGWAQTAPTLRPDWTVAGDGPIPAVNLGLRDTDPSDRETVTPAP